ncbi:response regulator transcription factor [Actinokineospora cianjurensis]|uniref:Response regulator receiver domain-containing protein n=1 Tax=Actinokineospora cianjurensis TaxID=585224 RepID=A0A421AUV6_9PSEU|nr:response regulator [Actinokineospora cianjurensis]RLK53875.1 response regulator receiver domain-containing protein [Actinokineospora cianjurensis]
MARVLVVEDDTDVRDLVAQWLREDHHEVLAVESAVLALAAVERNGLPHAVVLDVAMPGMDGVDLLHRLREYDEHLPAIFLSVLWSAADVQRMRDARAVYVGKPSSGDRLRTALRGLLGEGDAEGLV